MKQPSKEDIIKKWSSVLGPMGATGSMLDNLSQLAENQSNHILEESQSTQEFPSILPMAMKVATKTLSLDLCFASQEEIDEVKKKVQVENRDGKITSIIEGGEFVEKKLEDDEEYKELMKKGVTPSSAPSNQLFYLDFKYEGKKTRRSGKKHKKKNGSI
jgi:hypothetical protein